MESTGNDAVKSKSSKPHGFSVGPANLPDGTYRRKVTKIKKRLIQNAQLKKSYAKLKEQEAKKLQSASENNEHRHDGTNGADQSVAVSTSLELHPERQAMLDAGESDHGGAEGTGRGDTRPSGPNPRPYQRRKKPAPFGKEVREGQQRNEMKAARQAQIEESIRQREAKMQERDQYRRAMAKARTGGKNRDERKLGRESKVLLAKVQKMMAE